MGNYSTLVSAIQAVVRTNGNEEITGALLQQSLLAMIDSLGAGYQFMGVATTVTNPGTPDQKVFYLAGSEGIYTNFGGIRVRRGQIVALKYDSAWSAEAFNTEIDGLYKEEINDTLYVVDGNLNVVAKINREGLTDINIRPYFGDAFYISDANGNLVLRVDANGVDYVNKHWWSGKTFYTLGDSLCVGNVWQQVLINAGMSFDGDKNADASLPISVGGSATCGSVTESGFARARNLVNWVNGGHNCDILIIENINDLNYLAVSGAIDSPEYIEYADGTNNGNPLTIYGAYKGLLNYLITNLPKTVKFFWLIPTRFNLNWGSAPNDLYDYISNDSYQDLVKIQEDICKLYGVPILDMQQKSGINLKNGSDFYYNNNVHPKDAGYQRWGETIVNLFGN